MKQQEDILEVLVTLAEIAKDKKNGIMVYANLFYDAALEIKTLRDKNNELQKELLSLKGIEY
ncbi:MAG: hypothetical protein O3A39_04075 [Proteobacteria bacterium]|nr:hypothetical protein [Pseudomonadota bacterium]